MKKIKITTDYRERRAKAYPALGDQIDAISKGFRALIDAGISLPPETVSWVEQVDAVKAKFKKPKE
jgi:hypothetical protein